MDIEYVVKPVLLAWCAIWILVCPIWQERIKRKTGEYSNRGFAMASWGASFLFLAHSIDNFLVYWSLVWVVFCPIYELVCWNNNRELSSPRLALLSCGCAVYCLVSHIDVVRGILEVMI